MNRILVFGLLLATSAMAHAQLSHTSSWFGDTETTHCVTSYGVHSSNVLIGGGAGGAMSIHEKGHVDALLERTASPQTWSHISHSFHAFSVGNTPVQLTHMFSDTMSYNGKLVLGGGSPLNLDTTASITPRVDFWEFVDDNSNGEWDVSEDRYFVNSMSPGRLADSTGNGLEVYDKPYNVGTGWTYILGANRTYMYEIASVMSGITENGSSSPFFVATHEYGAPYTGWDLNFTYQAVPEPATFAGLGMAALAVASRRRRKA